MAPRRYKKKNYRNYKQINNYVPGWGGTAGRVAGAIRSYTSTGGVAYKALSIAKKVADAVNTEYKNHDVQLVSAPSFNGMFQELNTIAQGITDYQRVGSSLKCQTMHLRVAFTRASANANIRCVVIWDKQNVLTTPSDYFDSVGTAYGPQSFKNDSNKFRFKTLYDQIFILTDASSPRRNIDLRISLNKHTEFDGSTSNIRTGSLKVMMISDVDPTVPANVPVARIFSHLTYTDN